MEEGVGSLQDGIKNTCESQMLARSKKKKERKKEEELFSKLLVKKNVTKEHITNKKDFGLFYMLASNDSGAILKRQKLLM